MFINKEITVFPSWLFSALLFFAFFFPTFESQLGSSGAIILNGTVVFVMSCFLLGVAAIDKFTLTLRDRHLFNFYVLMFAFFFLHISISMTVGVVFGNVELITRDFFEFHRPIYYLLLFLLGFFTFKSSIFLTHYHKLLLVLFLTLVLFGLSHYIGLLSNISELYTKDVNIQSGRVSTPFVNPYDYAFMMSFFVFYFFLLGLYFSYAWFILFLLALIMFVLPQSRSVAVGFLVGFFVILPTILWIVSVKAKTFTVHKKGFLFGVVFLFCLAVFLLLIPMLLEKFTYLTGQFVKLIVHGDIGRSASIRLDQFLFAVDKAKSPLIFIFGNGPSKSEMEHVESIYNYQFYRYGLIGIFLYLVAPIMLTCYFSYRVIVKLGKKSLYYPLFLTVIIWFLTIPFMSIGNNFTEQIRLSFFFYTLLGIVVKGYYLTYGKGLNLEK